MNDNVSHPHPSKKEEPPLPPDEYDRIKQEQCKVRAYTTNAAFTAEASTHTKHGDTINIDRAPSQNRKANWSEKLTFQLNDEELLMVGAVCLGYLPGYAIPRGSKGLEMQRQHGCIFVRATQGKGICYALPLDIPKVYKLGKLIIEQLRQNPIAHNDTACVLACIKGATALQLLEPKE